MSNSQLYRSNDRVISGVIGGIAEYYNLEPTILRLVIVFLVMATGFVPGLITYIVAVFIIPNRPDESAETASPASDEEQEVSQFD